MLSVWFPLFGAKKVFDFLFLFFVVASKTRDRKKEMIDCQQDSPSHFLTIDLREFASEMDEDKKVR